METVPHEGATPKTFNEFVNGFTQTKPMEVNSIGLQTDEGWIYANEQDKQTEVWTKKLDDRGNSLKKIILSNGDEIIARRLKGKDNKEAMKMAGSQSRNKEVLANISDEYLPSLIALACTVNGKPQIVDYYNELFLNDYNRVMALVTDLNF